MAGLFSCSLDLEILAKTLLGFTSKLDCSCSWTLVVCTQQRPWPTKWLPLVRIPFLSIKLGAKPPFITEVECVRVLDLVGQQRDESLGLPLQVQVHVEQLAVERLVHLLLPLGTARLLHGPLHSGPVQIAGQAAQEDPHVLRTVQGHAELNAGKVEKEEEQKKRRKRGWRRRRQQEGRRRLQRSVRGIDVS